MNISLSRFAPENLVSQDGFGSRPVPRQPAHLILRLDLELTYGIFPSSTAASYSDLIILFELYSNILHSITLFRDYKF